MARRVCLAIGVGNVTPPKNKPMRFAYLDGAVVAARTIGNWALRSGFGDANVRIVDDGRVGGKYNPVTRERVQTAVDELFPAGAEVVEHLILAFCGHGVTDANVGRISWLFSDSIRLKYRVIADSFYTELLLHGVQRITLISDACREGPKDLDLMRLDPVRGIAVEGAGVESPKFDRFVACQDGQLGYMVLDPSAAGRPGKCVFSGVIADALWGIEKAAISGGVITTTTLGACVRVRTAERAKDYRLKLNPQCLVDPDAAVLYDVAKPPQGSSELQPWPPAGTAAVMGTAVPAADEADDADRNLELVHSDKKFRHRILGTNFGSPRATPFGPGGDVKIPGESKDLLQDLVALRTASAPKSRTAGKMRKVQAIVRRLEADAATDARKRAAAEVRRSLIDIWTSARGHDPNLIVAGHEATVWSRSEVLSREKFPAHIEFRVANDPGGTPILVELAGHSFTPVVLYAGLCAMLTLSSAGEMTQAYGQNDTNVFARSLEAIADFSAGSTRGETIDELAGLLADNKRADPVLGAICAYLYRGMADFDSIRRLACFYAHHGQPVPFDIALLGEMSVSRTNNGALLLQVPAVKARKRRNGGPQCPAFVSAATPERQARIGGQCPWLGPGWDYVGLARPAWRSLVDGLAEHAGEVRRSGFTTFPKAVGVALARMWGMGTTLTTADGHPRGH